MPDTPAPANQVDGTAALSLTESLLLALEAKGILDPAEIEGLCADAMNAHREAAAEGKASSFHGSVAERIRQIADRTDSVRGS